MRYAALVLFAAALAGCAGFRPGDNFPETRARFDRDVAQCRDRANVEAYGKSLPLAGVIVGGLYGAFHGAAAGAGAGMTVEGTLLGIAVGGGIGFVIGLGASIAKYDHVFDSCMESRRHHAT
jgi:outer membrane lipoprotein SlyB